MKKHLNELFEIGGGIDWLKLRNIDSISKVKALLIQWILIISSFMPLFCLYDQKTRSLLENHKIEYGLLQKELRIEGKIVKIKKNCLYLRIHQEKEAKEGLLLGRVQFLQFKYNDLTPKSQDFCHQIGENLLCKELEDDYNQHKSQKGLVLSHLELEDQLIDPLSVFPKQKNFEEMLVMDPELKKRGL